MKKLFLAVIAIVFMLGIGQANAYIVNNSYSGWYTDYGSHDYANLNYCSGNIFEHQYNNFFIFDLSGVSGTITGATFNVYSSGINSTGTYSIYETSLSSSAQNDASNDIATFSALTSGDLIGAISLNPNMSYTTISITLNPYGLAWLQSNEGKTIVLGGSFPMPSSYSENFAFGYSEFVSTNNLNIQTGASVPEPATMLLLGLGLVGIAGFRKKIK